MVAGDLVPSLESGSGDQGDMDPCLSFNCTRIYAPVKLQAVSMRSQVFVGGLWK